MSNKLPITAIVLTYNEEVNLSHCLSNLKPHVDEIIVVDSYSEDKTVEIAEEYTDKVVQHEFENQAQQFNWALESQDIKNEWIFWIDADEWVTEDLWKELYKKLPQTSEEVTGFYMKRRVYFLNRWIKHGGYYPTWILRLFRKNKAKSENREVDEHVKLLEGRAQRLENDFVDQNRKGIKAWIDKHNDYSTREARERIKMQKQENDPDLGDQPEKKRKMKRLYNNLPLFFRSFLYFIYRYIFRLGFLDGKEGLIFHFLQGFWHQFTIDAKIYEQKKVSEQSSNENNK
ncbi:MAG: glycosyltransferase family 2 protein [Candidatus Magasanikbacteria bacterium]